MTLDAMLNPFSKDRPLEWATIPGELLEALLRDREERPTSALFMTPTQRAAINRIAVGEVYLLRNFLRAGCETCKLRGTIGVRHEYVSVQCVPVPFSSLRQIALHLKESLPNDPRFHHIQPSDIIPIELKLAKELNDRIVRRGGKPVMVQRPLRRGEVDEEVINRRIVRRARALRVGGALNPYP